MRLKSLAVCASLLAMAACDSEKSNPVLPSAGGPRLATTAAPRWSLYTGQTPTEIHDAAPGWVVGSRFTSSKAGKIMGFRFYRAAGETGTNYGRLWNSAGQRLKQSNPFPSGTGWVTVMLDNPVAITANTTYRVSVNTNNKQVKTGGGYAFNGPLSNGPLYSDGGYYGQPTGSMPTSSSASYFFIDVIFDEDVPPPLLPDLVIAGFTATQTTVTVTVCNYGAAPADASTLQYYHRKFPPVGDGPLPVLVNFNTPALAVGQCHPQPISDTSEAGYFHDYQARADVYNVVTESNENNNSGHITWPRY
jgi:hypothetical protein